MSKKKHKLAWIREIFPSNLKENWKVVVLCILAATTFWFFSSLNKTYTTRINYPISFSFENDSVVVIGKLPEKISLNVSGGGWSLLRKTYWFNVSPISITLENPTDTKYIVGSSLRNTVSEQLTEPGLRLIDVVTDSLFIHIEKLRTKDIFIKVDSSNVSLRAFHRIVSPIITTPSSVQFTGPSSIIETLSDTLYINLMEENIDKSINTIIEIDNPIGSKYISYSPEEVQVRFDVASFVEIKKPVTLETKSFPKDSSAFIKRPRVILSFWVQEKFAERAQRDTFKVMVNYKKMNKKDSTILPEVIDYPEYIYDLKVEPGTVKVQHGQ